MIRPLSLCAINAPDSEARVSAEQALSSLLIRRSLTRGGYHRGDSAATSDRLRDNGYRDKDDDKGGEETYAEAKGAEPYCGKQHHPDPRPQ